MSNTKTVIRFFTIADYEEEEAWLRSRHNSGWKLVKTAIPCFYVFESCEPEDVVYRLDYKNNTEDGEYLRMFKDYGWECFNSCMGWLYFRKPISETDGEQDAEIFSDDVSRVDMINHIFKTRMIPLLIFLWCCVIPNYFRSLKTDDPLASVCSIVLTVLLIVYLYLIVYCGIKLGRLKKKYSGK